MRSKTSKPNSTPIHLDLVSFVSHQLKTPLTTVKLNLDLLKSQAAPNQKISIQRIDEEINRIIDLVASALDMRAIKNGLSSSLFLKWHSWNKIILNIKNQLSVLLNSKNIQLMISGPNKQIESYIDNLYIEQALVNIIKNAIEYSPIGGSIDFNLALNKGTLCIKVSDKGKGITELDLKNIFTPFYKTHKASVLGKTQADDFLNNRTGLGLVITRQVVLSHGGQIAVANQPSGGVCVTFNLPKSRYISKVSVA